jgi:ABC-type nitrate/sulfonate/bicarbonate transport system ATPase subunit
MASDKLSRESHEILGQSPRLSANHLHVRVREKRFASGHAVLGNLEFIVHDTEFVSLLGPSGCGKTTLLRLIAGLDQDYEGEISVGGIVVRGPDPGRGVVFQESRLLPWMTVAQNVGFALPGGLTKIDRADRVLRILRTVRLSDAASAWPFQLSGGMEKRVALARALVSLPSILLMDEPFSALDPLARYALQDEVSRLHSESRLTTLLVTHDVDEAIHLSDRVLLISGEPASLAAEIIVPIPRPRSRTSTEALVLQQKIMDLMLSANHVAAASGVSSSPVSSFNPQETQ